MNEKITLGGRAFLPVGEVTSLAHELHFGALLARAGLREGLPLPDEDLAAYELRVIERLLDARLLLPMMACLIVPESAVRAITRHGLAGFLERLRILPPLPAASGWTPEVAAQTDAFLGDLDEKRDKDRVRALVLELLLPFWTRGLRSWAASLRSSSAALAAAVAAESAMSTTPTATGEA